MAMEPRISFITLGVNNLERAIAFYEGVLGLVRQDTSPGVAFFQMGPTMLALFPRADLAADAGLPAEGSGFKAFALAHNVRSETAVDDLLALALSGGAKLIKPGQPTFWGGYAGYFEDPEGFLWEIAHNPDYPDL